MQFTKVLLAAAAFAVAAAQVKFTNTNFTDITVGTPFTITWSGADSGVTLKLKGGPANAQVLVETITTGQSGTSFTWTPESTIVDGTYNFEIDAAGQINYSIQFPITGGSASSSLAALTTSLSLTSAVTSVTSSVTTTATSTATSFKNSTSSSGSSGSKTGSPTSKSTSAGTSSSGGTVPTSNDAAQYASPFAFVLMSFVAIAALN